MIRSALLFAKYLASCIGLVIDEVENSLLTRENRESNERFLHGDLGSCPRPNNAECLYMEDLLESSCFAANVGEQDPGIFTGEWREIVPYGIPRSNPRGEKEEKQIHGLVGCCDS